MIRFLLLQIIAHTVTDFYLQTDKSCADKEKKGFKSSKLYIHALITFAFSWFLSFSLDFWWLALIIAVSHLFVDAMKSYASKCKYIFFIDQIIHLIVIAIVCYKCNCSLPNYLHCIEEKHLALFLGALVCIKPSNIIIKEIFKTANIKVSKGSGDAHDGEVPDGKKDGEVSDKNNNDEVPDEKNNGEVPDEKKEGDLPNAGKLIGIVERLLSFVFILLGQYEAVGFIMAAKSLLRFAEGDKAKSEYVLIGTLLSFSIAIFVGIAIKLYFGL